MWRWMAAGNVYFCDGRNNAIKKWSAANNTVTTLVPGLSNPQGVAVGQLGQCLFCRLRQQRDQEVDGGEPHGDHV